MTCGAWMLWLVKVLGWFGRRGMPWMGGAHFKTRAPGCKHIVFVGVVKRWLCVILPSHSRVTAAVYTVASLIRASRAWGWVRACFAAERCKCTRAGCCDNCSSSDEHVNKTWSKRTFFPTYVRTTNGASLYTAALMGLITASWHRCLNSSECGYRTQVEPALFTLC